MYQIDVAVPVALEQTFTYLSLEPVAVGTRVKVPFGRRVLIGVCMAQKLHAANSEMTLKHLQGLIDPEPFYSEDLLNLGRWLSSYYLHPIGEVLKAMLPVSVIKATKISYKLTDEGASARIDESHERSEVLKFLWPRKGEFSQANLRKKCEEWSRQKGVKMSLKPLEKAGLIHKETVDKSRSRETWSPSPTQEGAFFVAPPPTLSAAQEEILKSFDGSDKAFLLHGITGAGKTEIYLRLIARVQDENPTHQVLVMVPEIALTPQMTRVFSQRFPGKVAVVHSAMAPADRWEQLQLVRRGERSILIGPRSAVFAAFQNLHLLIVDEEHDGSYKQTTGLTYNGRDVAVMRGFLEKKMVVLGSATPSMESYANAVQGKYRLLELHERANQKALPQIECIIPEGGRTYARKLSGAKRSTAVIDLPMDDRVLEALEKNLADGKQAMVLVNRRGYAYYLLSLRDKKAIACPHCSISLTVHEKSTWLRCHYCDYQRSLDAIIPANDADAYVLVGYGSELMELFLREKLPTARVRRVDSDSVQQKDALPRILEEFRAGSIDILVGTQMLAKGHDFAKVTLICIMEIDQSLNLPDFRAGEKTFQLLVQAAGRAGRGDWPGHVLVQTLRADHPVLRAGLKQDYSEFWQDQVQFRKVHNYPPFSRMIVLEISSAKREKLLQWASQIEAWIGQRLRKAPEAYAKVSILGPSAPPLETVRGRSRRTILLMASDRAQLWGLAREILQTFSSPPGDLRLRVDVDPQSLL